MIHVQTAACAVVRIFVLAVFAKPVLTLISSVGRGKWKGRRKLFCLYVLLIDITGQRAGDGGQCMPSSDIWCHLLEGLTATAPRQILQIVHNQANESLPQRFLRIRLVEHVAVALRRDGESIGNLQARRPRPAIFRRARGD
jgi:hypothetical protein